MKKYAMILAVAVSGVANATVYNDAASDIALGSFPHLDITSVEVTNTLTDITFKYNLTGDPVNPNWGKYNVVLRRVGAATLDNSATNNAWSREYGLNGGSTAFIGGWTDAVSNNQQNWTFNGGWVLNTTVTSTIGANSVAFTASLVDLGLAVGDQIVFDAITTGGGDDTAVDSLTGVSPTAWNQIVPMDGVTYNVVPEPGTFAALGLGLAALRRRRAK